MAIYNNSRQTINGRILENQVRSGLGKMEFVCLKTGAGTYSESEKTALDTAKNLKEVKQTFDFSDIRQVNDGDGNYLLLESIIRNEGLEEGYYLTEIGLYARLEGTEESVLYCISLVDEADYIPQQTDGKIYEIILQSLIKCYDAEQITIEYTGITYVTMQAFQNYMEAQKRSDTKDNKVTFESSDTAEPDGMEEIAVLVSGEQHKDLWSKVSKAVKNQRYIQKAIGTQDISAIGDGTVTGGISALAAALGGFSFYPEELTQAEYNALPAETKSIPKLLFVIKKE